MFAYNALNWISKTFGGHSLDQLEANRLLKAQHQDCVEQLCHLSGQLKAIAACYGADLQTDGANLYMDNCTLWVVNQDNQANQVWAQYLSLSGQANGLGGAAPSSHEPIYCAAYANAFTIRSSYGLPCPDVNPDYIAYWLAYWQQQN